MIIVIVAIIVIISINHQVWHRGIGRFLFRDAVHFSSSALAPTPWLTQPRAFAFAFVTLFRSQVSV